ncbi:MAG: hypothetical protein AAGF04_05280 [Chlamydiota bacterium]
MPSFPQKLLSITTDYAWISYLALRILQGTFANMPWIQAIGSASLTGGALGAIAFAGLGSFFSLAYDSLYAKYPLSLKMWLDTTPLPDLSEILPKGVCLTLTPDAFKIATTIKQEFLDYLENHKKRNNCDIFLLRFICENPLFTFMPLLVLRKNENYGEIKKRTFYYFITILSMQDFLLHQKNNKAYKRAGFPAEILDGIAVRQRNAFLSAMNILQFATERYHRHTGPKRIREFTDLFRTDIVPPRSSELSGLLWLTQNFVMNYTHLD